MNAIKSRAACAILVGVAAVFISANALAALPIQHWVQASGAKVYLVETHTLPMIDVQVDFDAGSRRDPAGKSGLANMAAAMTGKGILARDGQPALDENQVGEAWADLGAGFGGGAGADRMSFTLRSLSYPDLLPKAVALAARQLGEPAFPEAMWKRDRERVSAAIREANTKPGTVAEQAFLPLVYGKHPYGAYSTEASLAAFGVEDMRAFYAAHVEPCRAKVSLVGDLTRAQADQLVAQLLARLPQRAAAQCQPLPAVAEVPALTAPAAQDIPFASAQAHVLIGQPGYKRNDPAFFTLLVGNYVLGGGGFVSRLTEEVREKRGLSYSVYSYFSPGLHAGAFTVGLQTRPDQARQAIQVAQDVVRRFVADGPSDTEMKAAKDNLIGGFALRIDTNRKLLDNVANIAWNDLPLDYLDTWTAQVQKVTAAQVKAAFASKLQPERMVTVVVGAPAPQAAR